MRKLTKKLVVVGDGYCGKTALLYAFKNDVFEEEYIPTVFETYVTEITFKNALVNLYVWDTAGQEDYERLRPLSYPDTDIVLICYSIDNPGSLTNVKELWLSEIKHYLPSVPYLLIGNKKDLRNDESVIEELARTKEKLLTFEDGLSMAKDIGAAHFLECSAKTRENVREVFQSAAKLSIKSKFSCTIL